LELEMNDYGGGKRRERKKLVRKVDKGEKKTETI
jgi:hypothetical protein